MTEPKLSECCGKEITTKQIFDYPYGVTACSQCGKPCTIDKPETELSKALKTIEKLPVGKFVENQPDTSPDRPTANKYHVAAKPNAPYCWNCGKPCTIASKPSRKELAQEAERTGHIPTDLDVLPMDADDEPTSKPDASPDRLLTIQETLVAVNRYPRNPAEGTHTLSDREVTFCRTVSQAQDAKTYPLAFEAGKKEQADKDLLESYQALAEAKKQGMRELVEWGDEECPHTTTYNVKCSTIYILYKEKQDKRRKCEPCWQAKMKELGL